MSEKIIVPALGESITEATVSKWLKEKGEIVKLDEPIVELETDKVNVEVPSPGEGVLSEINFKDGDTVEVGALLGTLSLQDTKVVSIRKLETIKQTESDTLDQKETTKKIVSNNVQNISMFNEEQLNDNKQTEKPLILGQTLILNQEVFDNNQTSQAKNLSNTLSPAVRKIAKERKIDLENIQGTGKNGRILKGDLIELMDQSPKPSERKEKF